MSPTTCILPPLMYPLFFRYKYHRFVFHRTCSFASQYILFESLQQSDLFQSAMQVFPDGDEQERKGESLSESE